MRGALASLLILIGAVLTLPASVAVWEQRVLTNRDAFIELGQEAFKDPAIQDRLTERITEEAVSVAAANGYSFPDNAIGAIGRNQAGALTRAVVGELPNSVIGEQALVTAHEAVLTVIDNDTDRLTSSDDEVRVNFRPVVEQVLQTFETAVPNFPDITLPPGTGEIVIVQEKDIAFGFRVARWFDGAAVYIALLPVICFIAALVIAASRPVALLFIGIALAVTAGLRIVFYEGPMQSAFTDNAVDDPSLRPAANGIYDVIAGSLVAQDMLLIVAGIFIIVASVFLFGLKRAGI